MEPFNTHFLKLTIAGLNTLLVHSEQPLFCWSIRLHIGMLVDGNHCDTVAGIELMSQWFADGATTLSNTVPCGSVHAKSSAPENHAWMHQGVATARRGGASADQVINTWSLAQLRTFLGRKRGPAVE